MANALSEEAIDPMGAISGGFDMANKLKQEEKDKIREAYSVTGSLKAAARASECSRNTVRRYLKSEGLYKPMLDTAIPRLIDKIEPKLQPLDFSFLEKMVEASRQPGDPITYKNHIQKMTKAFIEEIGVSGAVDTIRLENAIFQYIVFRRFYICSLEASDKQYLGPFTKAHDKLVKAVATWTQLSNQALDQFNRLIRELEIKYGKRSPEIHRSSVFVQNQQVNVGVQEKVDPSLPIPEMKRFKRKNLRK